MSDGRMSGKVAIITGGASGLGRACAVRFAQEGAAVCVADRDMDGANETVRLVEAEGQRGLAFEIDVREEAAHDDMVAACARELGGVDVLVAAAGITGRERLERGSARLLTLPTEMVHEVFEVNLLGVFFSDRAVARWLIEHERPGAIVNISSIGARRPHFGSFYGATKAGVWSLTKVWALELTENGIRVNAIAPGYIDTPMLRRGMGDGPEANERIKETLVGVPMDRLGKASEIASAALFLVTDDSSYMTGEMLHVAGGLYMA